ncbi:NAD(P)H-hydrate epimerase [Raoultibacter massiliensis]|uniref:NAD(P)H-hydrate epimerase n=1 Tax=Raoultibacter massiliensis TaxID=1852371 RepID=UPI000C82BD57|nr:NAD(P)H-hydrate epimerase [Raoultibacter massiliensis]
MNVYTNNIVTAAVAFPFIAFAITVPYMIYQYRKFGSIPWLRTIIVYSFVFYLMCAYFLVILPLPDDRSAVVAYAATPQLFPFNFVREFLAQTTFNAGDPSTWLATLRDPYVYEAIFNVLLLTPLGMYLRYYFRRTWWQTLLIGFSVTLFFELSQLTGLWGVYAHPYRLFDVDDLMLNTLGAMVGFWIVGPALRLLPDIRLVNEEAREAGMRASATKRGLSFFIDVFVAQTLSSIVIGGFGTAGLESVARSQGISWGLVSMSVDFLFYLLCFVIVPVITKGQTPGQMILKLRIVRPDASPARWYQYLARYGFLYALVLAPLLALNGIVSLDPSRMPEMGMLASVIADHRAALVVCWIALMCAWALSLIVRAIRSAVKKRPFVMLNGILSATRVMTDEAVGVERDRKNPLDVDEVSALESLIEEGGTPLSELMERAGIAVADEVRAWVPDPAPVVVLAGSGNNGGDGWVCARALAEAGYKTTLVTPDIAERMKAEPARSTALAVFSSASENDLPLSVLVAPDADVLADALDDAMAIVDAILGTGFSGTELREPYAGWIRAANRRRFEGSRGKGRGFHRKRRFERADHDRARRSLPRKVKDAPFAVAVDVPSGLSAQTGALARPTFVADATVTMLAYKPGLVKPQATRYTGTIELARLVDTAPYTARLREACGDR